MLCMSLKLNLQPTIIDQTLIKIGIHCGTELIVNGIEPLQPIGDTCTNKAISHIVLIKFALDHKTKLPTSP